MDLLPSFLRRGEPAGAHRVDLALHDASYRYADGTVGLKPTTIRFDGGMPAHTAVIGLNGAGKSTLMRLLGCRLAPTGGTVDVVADGTVLHATDRSGRRRIERVTAMVDPDRLPRDLERGATLQEGLVAYLATHRVGRAEREARAARLLADFDLAPVRHLPVAALDLEHRHLMAAAVAASLGPAVMVADEPTRGLDERGSRHVIGKVLSAGIPVVFSTHDVDLLPDAGLHVARTVVLDEARVVFDGSPQDATETYARLIRDRIQRISSRARSTAPSTRETLRANASGSGSSESAM